MKTYRVKWALLLFVLLVGCIPAQKSTLVNAWVVSPSQAYTYLDRGAAIQHVNGQPLAAAGVALYALINGHPHLLLARETKDGTYTLFGGKLDSGETFAQGALRECWEESAGLYHFSRQDLNYGRVYYGLDSNGHEGIFVFLKTDQIFTTPDLLTAQSRFKDESFFEKDDFVWVPFEVLLNHPPTQDFLRLKEGHTLKLRDRFKEALAYPAFLQMLRQISQAEKLRLRSSP